MVKLRTRRALIVATAIVTNRWSFLFPERSVPKLRCSVLVKLEAYLGRTAESVLDGVHRAAEGFPERIS